MKKINYSIAAVLIICIVFLACGNSKNNDASSQGSTTSKAFIPTPEFSAYWYTGEAEITSFDLQQARYGEMRTGEAVLIYVTEDFLPMEQVKADKQDAKNIPVLKLNASKNFNTGIYPYSIMQSNFYPVANNSHALKLSTSVQEWCGQAYLQLNNRKTFEFTTHSYFEGEADKKEDLPKAILENEIWNKLRIDPSSLPKGEQQIIPSLEYSRLMHKEVKAYPASTLLVKDNGVYSYTILYPSLDRNITIRFNASFPYDILGWTETYKDGSGPAAKKLTSIATRKKQIKLAYWSKNKNADAGLRDSLGLK